MTSQPLKIILFKPDLSGRLVAWAVELSQYHIEYQKRSAVKRQAFADFIVECTFPEEWLSKKDSADIPNPSSSLTKWTLYFDGSSTAIKSGVSIIQTSPKGFQVKQALKFQFKVTNNESESEYEAPLAGLGLARALGIQKLKAFSDSQLMVRQVLGEYNAKEHKMAEYLKEVQRHIHTFRDFTI